MRNRKFSLQGFTMIELLVVVGLILLFSTLVVPAFNQVGEGSLVTQAGYTLNDQITLARQKAVARKTITELRFIRENSQEAAGQPPGYSAVQVWQVDPKSGNATPAERLIRLPVAVIVNASLSPLLASADGLQANFGSMGARPYERIRFHTNGRLEKPTSLRNSCLTAQLKRDDRATPVNYYTLQINPLTGRIATYRP